MFFLSLALKMWQTLWAWLRGKGVERLEQQATGRSAYSVGEGSGTQKGAGHVSCAGRADEVSEGNRNSLGKWSRGHPCYLVAESLASLCPCPEACWKTVLPSDHPMYLAKEIAKQQSAQAAAWLLLMAYSQMREQRDHLKTKLLDKRKAELRSQRGTHRDLKRKGFPEQAQATKIKADKQRLSVVLNPGNEKDSLRGLQERAPRAPGSSSLLAKRRRLTSSLIPRGPDAASTSRAWQHRYCTGAWKGMENGAMESLPSLQLKRKPRTKKKTAFRLESLWKESEVMMPHGMVLVESKKKKRKPAARGD